MSDEQRPWDDELPQGIEVTLTPEMMEYAAQRVAESMALREEARTTSRVILGERWCSSCGFDGGAKRCDQDFRCCTECNHPVMVATPLEVLEAQVFLTDRRERWCTACGYSLWSCTNVTSQTDGMEVCCDVCDHPVWIATPMEEDK
jgi:hypothetical protein